MLITAIVAGTAVTAVGKKFIDWWCSSDYTRRAPVIRRRAIEHLTSVEEWERKTSGKRRPDRSATIVLAALINQRFGPPGSFKDDRANRLAIHQFAHKCLEDEEKNKDEQRLVLANVRLVDRELLVHRAMRRSTQLSVKMRLEILGDLDPDELLANEADRLLVGQQQVE